jgi:ankyrin repeat protein
MILSLRGNVDIVKHLLTDTKGLRDIDKRDVDGNTALMLAANNGNYEVVNLLITAGADIDARSFDTGETALLYAAHNQHFKTFQLLLSRGANCQIVDYEGKTCIMHLASADKIALIELCYNNTLNKKDSFIAQNPIDTSSSTTSLINAATRKHGETAIMIASRYGHCSTINKFFELGAKLNLRQKRTGNKLL